MAQQGTTVPDDSAKPRTIPSVPRPDQKASALDPNTLGASTLQSAADNAGDIPRVGVKPYLSPPNCSLARDKSTH
jgi:hypothetical protein